VCSCRRRGPVSVRGYARYKQEVNVNRPFYSNSMTIGICMCTSQIGEKLFRNEVLVEAGTFSH
jgi:hypothetical protein